MKTEKNPKINITIQGAPIANHAYFYRKNKDIACICIDFSSKYCYVFSTGSGIDSVPCVDISANKRSLYLHAEKKRGDLTEIEFPEYKNWSIFTAEFSRYTCYVTLVKDVK